MYIEPPQPHYVPDSILGAGSKTKLLTSQRGETDCTNELEIASDDLLLLQSSIRSECQKVLDQLLNVWKVSVSECCRNLQRDMPGQILDYKICIFNQISLTCIFFQWLT